MKRRRGEVAAGSGGSRGSEGGEATKYETAVEGRWREFVQGSLLCRPWLPQGQTTHDDMKISRWGRSGVSTNNGGGLGFTWGSALEINSDEDYDKMATKAVGG